MVIDTDDPQILPPMNNFGTVDKNSSVHDIPLQATIFDDETKDDKDFIITELSHDEVDLQIQFNRVMYVLKRMIEKMKVVSYLPTLIEDDGKLLKQYFNDETVQYILEVCEKDAVLVDNIGQRSYYLRKKDTSPSILRNTKMDQAMVEVIAILYNDKAIKKNIIETDDIVLNETASKLIEALNMLYLACEHKLQMSAAEEKARQQKLRKAWRNNLIVKKDIQNLHKRLTEQRDNFSREIYDKKRIIENYQQKMDLVRENSKERINKRVAESEKLMGLEAAASEAKIATLTADAKKVQTEYQALLENHITYEKSLRAKRLKVETQLATWLAKYDQDIGERHYEIEELTKAYDKEKAEMDALQQLFDDQEDEYEELMEEKEEEDRRLLEIKMYRILSNVAARKIQQAWKRYWERKQARLKAKRARAKAKKMGTAGAPKKGGKAKGKKKSKKGAKSDDPKLRRESNAVDDLSKMFAKSNVLDDLTTPAFDKAPVTVEL